MSEENRATGPKPVSRDVVIVGGGLAGLPLALALSAHGVSVSVIDVLDPAHATDAAFDGRISSIALASARMLQQLGVWPDLEAHAQPVADIIVTDGKVREGASPFFLHFDHQEIGDEPLGYMIENRHVRIALLKAVERAIAKGEPLELLAPAKVSKLNLKSARPVVSLADGTELVADLCVAADGRGSMVRGWAGFKTVGWDYDQLGIVTTVEHELSHDGVAQELFLPSGPFAILPMVGNRSSLVWTEKSELGRAIMGLDDERFAQECKARFGSYLGEVKPVGPRWSYPLSLQLAQDYVKPGVALIGDAAHGIHPLAGQGLNLGLRDVAALAEVVVEAKRLGLGMGQMNVLERYQTWRRFDNVSLALICDGLNRLFSNDVGPLRFIRDLGLGLVNKIAPARKMFMRHARGTVGELPKLMQGQPI